jgi:hypothetical protein
MIGTHLQDSFVFTQLNRGSQHWMHCVGCAIAPFETIAEISAIYGLSLEQLLVDLRDHCASREERDNMNSTTTATLTGRSLGVDRRKTSDRPMLRGVARIWNEYVEMPGLVLIVPQAARLAESERESLRTSVVAVGGGRFSHPTTWRRPPHHRCSSATFTAPRSRHSLGALLSRQLACSNLRRHAGVARSL